MRFVDSRFYHSAKAFPARSGRVTWMLLRVWCKYSNELYDIVINQYYG